MLSETGSGVTKTHVAVLSVVVLVASASAAVNVRDPMNVFGDLNVRGGKLDMHQNQITNTTEVEFSSDYLKDYANTEGIIDTEGASQATADYQDGEISHEQLRTVETFFFNEVPVKNNILEEYDSDGNNKIGQEELQSAVVDFIVDSELSKGEIDLVEYYYLNEVPITEPASSIDAAKITSSGKLIASGIIGRQKANFTIGNDINMQGNNIYNIGNLNGNTGGGGDGGSLSGSPVFGSVSYTKMGETTEYVAGSSSTGGVSADFDSVKTMSSGDSVSVSRTAQLGGTTKFRVLGGIVNLDTDGPPGGYSRHFASALQRDLGYIQLLVDGEVVNEVQNLNEWSDSDRIVYFETLVSRNREPTITTDPISVETGDTVTARVVADQEVDTDEVGSGCCGKFYQYVVLKRVDK